MDTGMDSVLKRSLKLAAVQPCQWLIQTPSSFHINCDQKKKDYKGMITLCDKGRGHVCTHTNSQPGSLVLVHVHSVC